MKQGKLGLILVPILFTLVGCGNNIAITGGTKNGKVSDGSTVKGTAKKAKYVWYSDGETLFTESKVTNGKWKMKVDNVGGESKAYFIATDKWAPAADFSKKKFPDFVTLKYTVKSSSAGTRSANSFSEKASSRRKDQESKDIKATPSSSSSSKKSTTVSLAQTNAKIAESLKRDQQWAAGKLDANGNPTSNGTPNENFRWTTYINSIKMSKSQILTVQVNGKVRILTTDAKKDLAVQAQNLVLGVMTELGTANNADYDGLYTDLMSGEIVVAHSSLSDYRDIKVN